MMKKKKIALGVVLLCIGALGFAWVTRYRTTRYREVNHPYSTLDTLNDEHFDFRIVFGMFAFHHESIGSFNATNGYWIELDISVTSDDPYKREARLEITSAHHGVIFDVTANKFTQTIGLDYDDDYNIMVEKRAPFYTTITVRGKIDVYHQETVWHDNWVSEPYQEQFPTYFLILPSSLIVISIIILIISYIKHSEEKAGTF